MYRKISRTRSLTCSLTGAVLLPLRLLVVLLEIESLHAPLGPDAAESAPLHVHVHHHLLALRAGPRDFARDRRDRHQH